MTNGGQRPRRPLDMNTPLRRCLMWLVGMLVGSTIVVLIGMRVGAPDGVIGTLVFGIGLITIYNIRRIWQEHRSE